MSQLRYFTTSQHAKSLHDVIFTAHIRRLRENSVSSRVCDSVHRGSLSRDAMGCIASGDRIALPSPPPPPLPGNTSQASEKVHVDGPGVGILNPGTERGRVAFD